MSASSEAEARQAAHCSPTDWQRIKSRGRQGVIRAFKEGGTRKAAIKLAKMIAAADAASQQPLQTAAAAAGEGNAKKRRRRENQRERNAANARGELTSGQLFWLFGSESTTFARIGIWKQLPIHCGRHPARKAATRAAWAEEFTHFAVEFDRLYKGPGVTDAQEHALFVSTVSEAVTTRPSAAAAAELWSVLDSKGFAGAAVGGVDVPIAGNNVGLRMLVAMGWKEGGGLGAGEQGMKEPLRVVARSGRRKVGVGWCKWKQT